MEYTTSPTILYCTESKNAKGGKYLNYFYPNTVAVRFCGEGNPIYKVEVKEGKEQQVGYWAWWDEKDKEFCHVYSAKFLVEMCFPYGTKIEEERGNGKLVPVDITILEEVENK